MPDWKRDLVDRYPHLFTLMQDGRPVPSGGYPTVGDGWRELIEKAVERLAAAVAGQEGELQIVQVKEKFGGLRIYTHGSLPQQAWDAVHSAIDLAEARADETCEECGSRGRLYDDGGWLLTRCSAHARGSPVPGRGRYVKRIAIGRPAARRSRRYDYESDSFVDLPPDET